MNIFLERKTLTTTNMRLIQVEQSGFNSKYCYKFDFKFSKAATSYSSLSISILVTSYYTNAFWILAMLTQTNILRFSFSCYSKSFVHFSLIR